MTLQSCTHLIAHGFDFRECLTPGIEEGEFDTFSEGDFDCVQTYSKTGRIMRVVCEHIDRRFTTECPADANIEVSPIPDISAVFEEDGAVHEIVLPAMAITMIACMMIFFYCIKE